MNLIITSITIVDLTNKEAKKIPFSPNKNLLTSNQNHLGKSVIMKSIYYTLGAEVYFSAPIRRLNLLTYIDFSLENVRYRVCRLNTTFTLYRNGCFIEKYSSVSAFGETLSSLFKLEINLVGKDQDGSIIKCPPAFFYLPYYIDQENGWSPNSFSFDRMTQFDMPQRKNSYFFHLGTLDNEFIEISKRQKVNDRKINVLTKENDRYITVIDTLKSGIDDTQMSFDTTSLEHAISLRRKEIKDLLNEIAKSRNTLIEAEDHYIQLSHDKEILAKYIKKKNSKTVVVEDEYVECPRCNLVFERTLAQKLEKTYLLESLHDDYSAISNQQASLERKIEKLRGKFDNNQNLLKAYEKTLANDQEVYNAYVKSKATNQLLREYNEKIGANISEIKRLGQDNTDIRKLLSVYTKEKTQTNDKYLGHLNNLLINLDIPQDQIEANSEPGSALIASGAYGPRCKIAQMFAFLQTQKEVSPNIISFPLVIDSPNALEQDREHLDTVIRSLLTWNRTENQIIVSSIEGKETASALPDVNTLLLSNPKNHLFTKAEYEVYEQEIAELFTMF